MDNEIIKDLERLRESVQELQSYSKRALGFKKTIEYKQILFNVSRRFVIADLSPLAYVDLVQEIGDGAAETAIATLYDRVRPLLECRHEWAPVTGAHGQILQQEHRMSLSGTVIHACLVCTAYGLQSVEISLPAIGRGMVTPVKQCAIQTK